MQTQGGGNCANALTAAARLGLDPWLVSKIGDDGLGDQMLGELKNDGVHTGFVLREPNSPSPFTYIIVDRAGRCPLSLGGTARSRLEVSSRRVPMDPHSHPPHPPPCFKSPSPMQVRNHKSSE